MTSSPYGRSARHAADDDGWGPSTSVYSSSSGHRAPTSPPPLKPPFRPNRRHGADRSMHEPIGRSKDPMYPTRRPGFSAPTHVAAGPQQLHRIKRREPERGLPAWGALALLVGIAAIGGVIDTATNVQVRGGFNIGIVVASAVAILAVRRSAMLPVVLAPPIVYSGAAMFMLYVRSGGLHNRHEVINAALNYLVYGFPAIAIATAVVLIIAGVRMLARR